MTANAKDRILNAASRLFYAEGIRAVSVDAIAAKAGITKKTLYYHFKSKDEIVAAYLASRDQPNLKLFAKWFDEAEGSLAAKVEAIFRKMGIPFTPVDPDCWHSARSGPLRLLRSEVFVCHWWCSARGLAVARGVKGIPIFRNLAQSARHPKWRGCGFLRTAAELANMPGHPAMRVGAAHKKKFEAWLAEQFAAGGLAQAENLARQVAILMDGAFSAMLVHRDATYAETAGTAAHVLVQNSTGGKR